MKQRTPIYNCAQLIDLINEIGFLPLLDSGVEGFSADAMVDEDCRYVLFPDGGWDWPLWKWKGTAITDGRCVYGKFFAGKAGFVSLDWWPHFCNYRRSLSSVPEEGSVEEGILQTLQCNGSLITRELRTLCGFTGPKMRSLFDRYITRLQMECRVVTENFIYPHDRYGNEYGWGWSLLTIPETLYGRNACMSDNSPEDSFLRIINHLRNQLPDATEQQILKMIK